MRLEAVFLSVRPIVELLARSTMPSSTTLFSNNRNVQRARPLGGLEHARTWEVGLCRRSVKPANKAERSAAELVEPAPHPEQADG